MDNIEIPTIDDVFGILAPDSGITVVDSLPSESAQQLQNESQMRITGVGLSIFGARGGRKPIPAEPSLSRSDPTLAATTKPDSSVGAPSIPKPTLPSEAEAPEVTIAQRKASKVPAISVPLKVDSKTGTFVYPALAYISSSRHGT